jgi:hypothetical protein
MPSPASPYGPAVACGSRPRPHPRGGVRRPKPWACLCLHAALPARLWSRDEEAGHRADQLPPELGSYCRWHVCLQTNVPYCGSCSGRLLFPLRPVRKPAREGNDSSGSPTRGPQGSHSQTVRPEGPDRKAWGVGSRKTPGSVGDEGPTRKGRAGRRDEGSLGNTGEL